MLNVPSERGNPIMMYGSCMHYCIEQYWIYKQTNHDEKGENVIIDFALKVVGQNKDDVQIRGGLDITRKEEEDVFFSNCTVTGANGHGICGVQGASMRLKNVCVEKCGGHLFERYIFADNTTIKSTDRKST